VASPHRGTAGIFNGDIAKSVDALPRRSNFDESNRYGSALWRVGSSMEKNRSRGRRLSSRAAAATNSPPVNRFGVQPTPYAKGIAETALVYRRRSASPSALMCA
jgi:hypothetical protein